MEKKQSIEAIAVRPRSAWGISVCKELKNNGLLYIMFLPVIVYYLIFSYKPMYGALIALQNYEPAKGIIGSQWVGFKHFIDFFNNHYFWRVLKNTLVISVNSIIFGFPAPIILALLMNEVRSNLFKRTVQTLSYIPHFISLVVICGMIKIFTNDTGIIMDFLNVFGVERMSLLTKAGAFVPIYIISDIWQGVGWGSIVYLAALTNIDQALYEAATIDGAGRWKQTIHVTLPGIAPTIIIMLILRVGGLLSVGYEKIILLYSPLTYETADVISSFIYRKGLLEMNWSYSTAVGLFNSLINFILLICTNFISRKVSDTALW